MSTHPAIKRFLGPALLVSLTLAALYLVTLVYIAGETLLAGTVLVITALSVWVYTSSRNYAFRYLFPGIAAAMIFVVFPIFYTFTIGLTNYSSKNLLTFERATKYLMEETYRGEGATYNFTLHPDGAKYRIRLEETESGAAFLTQAVQKEISEHLELKAQAVGEVAFTPGEAMPMKEVIASREFLKHITIAMPSGTKVCMTGMREFAPARSLYVRNPDGSLANQESGVVIKPNFKTGFYETPEGGSVVPGFQVPTGLANYKRIFLDTALREPFVSIFIWTLMFSGLTVLLATSLGMLLAVILNWDALRFRSVYRLLLFLPYAVPGFISILVFKGLFNNNTGEINLILSTLFGIKPTWFSDPFLSKTMLLIVNTWLGFPYMMIVCMGLIKAIPADLYEASAVAGAGPLTNLFRITIPLIRRPLTPLLISSFAFNFNNFVLISLLTGGRPDILNTSVPAGTTDILVSYTYRIAFEDSGQQFGVAAAISTVIFLMVMVITLIQMRYTKIAQDENR